jgi:hypothetical protein
VTAWPTLFSVYRIVLVRDDEIVRGYLHPHLTPSDPTVVAVLDEWEGSHFIHPAEMGTEVTLIRRVRERPSERWWLHVLLGLITLATTTAAGSYFVGRNPFDMAFLPAGPFGVPFPTRVLFGELLPGLLFSVPLLGVLLGHELGHYGVARRHGMDVSPPYFIPAPHWLNVIGTFGAFIRLRSIVVNRIVLFDVGVAGPVASFLLSLPLAAWGLTLSRPLPELIAGEPARYTVLFGGQPIWLGDSILFSLLDRIFAGEGGFLVLHPFAFAGWLGLFVTALNLIPLAQLDGGHILYALYGERQRYAGMLFVVILLVLGYFWWGWWMWAAIILVLSRGVIRHPPVFDPAVPLTHRRKLLGLAAIIVFILTFAPVPLSL